MPQDLSQLATTKVPDASELVGTSSDLSSYNEKHKELAQGIISAFEILKKYDPNFAQNSKLGSLGLRIRSSEDVKEPVTVKVTPDSRFYGNPYLSEQKAKATILVPHSQLEGLIRDLMHVGPVYDSDWKDIVGDKLNTGVGLQHIIEVGNDNSLGKGYPAEFLSVIVSNRGAVRYMPIYYGTKVIEPYNADVKDMRARDQPTPLINDRLSRFDATDSGLYIPIGYNRLALMDSVLRYLIEEINQREVRAIDRNEERKKLTSPQELAQRKLL